MAPVCACSLLRAWGTCGLGVTARICLRQSPVLLKTRVCVLISVHTFYLNLIRLLSLLSIARSSTLVRITLSSSLLNTATM